MCQGPCSSQEQQVRMNADEKRGVPQSLDGVGLLFFEICKRARGGRRAGMIKTVMEGGVRICGCEENQEERSKREGWCDLQGGEERKKKNKTIKH